MVTDPWSEVAEEWASAWGDFPEPAWRAVLEHGGVGAGARVLDVGCGSGEFLAFCDRRGLRTAGIDPAPGMVALARRRTGDVRLGGAEKLPWGDATFDLVTSFNALQFAEDTDDALAEMVRVTVPGGRVAVANWAEAARNDLRVLEEALDDDPPPPDGELRLPGGLRELLTDGGLDDVVEGLVAVPWRAAGDDELVRGILLGEDPGAAGAVLAAARPYRNRDGGYLLVNHFRWAVGRKGPVREGPPAPPA
ncbi:class I SAM-dependent methyltransferase [Pseudosporangium ferrugineum]|uniref:Methyltransferase family protein n=1 Tax=Pseudosporangium ferrugineum TaxID=439699 RepID=A0A2T0S3I0_9ACTN|nr:class I SAM-dependent methyltransferase [Pseudosporangium ferrugineum]PRY27970.1 methyltransferase family protein [Pseudosporangium ferrugineum]